MEISVLAAEICMETTMYIPLKTVVKFSVATLVLAVNTPEEKPKEILGNLLIIYWSQVFFK